MGCGFWVLIVSSSYDSFSYDVCVMILVEVSKIETFCLKPTIKPHKLHHKYDPLDSAVGSADQPQSHKTSYPKSTIKSFILGYNIEST